MVAARHDLGGLDFVRTVRNGVPIARALDGTGTAVVYRVTSDGLAPQPTNRSRRVLHEGNWGGVLGSAANLIAGSGLAGLLVTGICIWARRKLGRRLAGGRREGAAAARRRLPTEA